MATAVRTVRARIAAAADAAGRDPSAVRLVAVTKGVTVERIDEALAAGVTDLGENRVQEADAKRGQVSGAATWHLLGHLQTNKAKRAAEVFDVVESVDSERVARALSERRASAERPPLPVLIEVELTGLATRTGVQPDAVEPLARALAGLDTLRLTGLMTIAPPVPDPADAAPYFRRLREIRDQLPDRLGILLPELSMGMSDDFAVAVAEGATMVRVGRAIFGARG